MSEEDANSGVSSQDAQKRKADDDRDPKKMKKETRGESKKSPISFLQEFTVRNRKELDIPAYQELDLEQREHNNMFFLIEVAVNRKDGSERFVAVGKGKNKKSAKLDASVNMLRKLADRNVITYSELNDSVVMPEANVNDGPVAQLYEFCVLNNLCLPIYVDCSCEQTTGPYVMVCQVEMLSQIATEGTSKADAKDAASSKVLEMLANMTEEELNRLRGTEAEVIGTEPIDIHAFCNRNSFPDPVSSFVSEKGPGLTHVHYMKLKVGKIAMAVTASSQKKCKLKLNALMKNILENEVKHPWDIY